jgi:hypothetical protein
MMNGWKTREYQVLGLRTGGDYLGAWAKIRARVDSFSPTAAETGPLDFSVPWLLEDLIRGVDYVIWESLADEIEMTPDVSAAWAFEHGKIQGRVEAATAGIRQIRGHAVSALSWSRSWGLEYPGMNGLRQDARDAVEIAWRGWTDMRYDLTGALEPMTA